MVMKMFRKVLFPTDFSEGAMRAIKRFNRDNESEVGECIILHVIDEGRLEDMLNGYSYFIKIKGQLFTNKIIIINY